MVRKGVIKSDDVNCGQRIYATPAPSLQEKTRRLKPLKTKEAVSKLPMPPILKELVNIILYIDIFYVNKNQFFNTKSEKLVLYQHSC